MCYETEQKITRGVFLRIAIAAGLVALAALALLLTGCAVAVDTHHIAFQAYPCRADQLATVPNFASMPSLKVTCRDTPATIPPGQFVVANFYVLRIDYEVFSRSPLDRKDFDRWNRKNSER